MSKIKTLAVLTFAAVCRERKRALVTPSSALSIPNSRFGDAETSAPLRHVQSLPTKRHLAIVAPIVGLVVPRSPSTVARFVVTVYVNAIKRVMRSGPRANRTVKFAKCSKAELNASPTIVRVGGVCGRRAASQGFMISLVLKGVPFLVPSVALFRQFSSQATAALRLSMFQVPTLREKFFSACALAAPAQIPVNTVTVSNHRHIAELSAREIDTIGGGRNLRYLIISHSKLLDSFLVRGSKAFAAFSALAFYTICPPNVESLR